MFGIWWLDIFAVVGYAAIPAWVATPFLAEFLSKRTAHG